MGEQISGDSPVPRHDAPTLDYAAPEPGNPAATASMALGWLSLACIALFCLGLDIAPSPGAIFGFLWPLCAILAILFGRSGLRRARAAGIGRRQAKTGIVLASVNVGLFALFLILLPRLGAVTPRGNRVKCASDLRQIGQGLMLYANDYQGRYPARFEPLITDYDLNPEIFVCPSSNDDKAQGPTTQALLADFAKPGRCSYVYLGASFNTSSPVEVVLAYEKIDHHESDGANFLFNDRHVEWFAKEQAKKMIKELEAGQNPPASSVSPPMNTDAHR